MKSYRTAFAISVSVMAIGLSAPVLAQDQAADEDGIADIVVTAQKRSESAQRTPLAVSAIAGEDLVARQITDFEKIAPSLPNVNFGKNVGFARIAIRGLGFDSTTAGQEGRVAYHTDGVYISRPSAQLGSFFDIARVEVIRGPQGTLYGRNATAGAVNVITNDPSQNMGGYAKLTVGDYGLVATEGAITGAVNDELSARIAFQTTDRGGYGKNRFTGESIDNEHSFGVRAKIKYEPSNTVKLILAAEYSRQDDNNFVYHYTGPGKPGLVPVGPRIGGLVATNPRDTQSNVDQINLRNFFGTNATFEADLGFGTLTSISAYRDSNTEFQSDADSTNLQIGTFQVEEVARQYSQELRLNGQSGRLKWVLGGYYFNENIFARTTINAVRAPNPALLGRLTQGLDLRGDFKTRATAIFGQLDYEVVDGLTLSAGLRYSHERKRVDQKGVVDFVTPFNLAVPPAYNQFQNGSTSFNATTPRFGIEYRFTPKIMAYATYAKGFKSGGYALSAFGLPVQPEKLTDYEAGIKSDLLDGHLRLNLSGFYYDYTNLQVQRIVGGTAILVNAAASKVKGLESEFILQPFDGFELSGNASLLDTKFTSFLTEDSARLELGTLNLAGNRLSQAPKYLVNLAAQYAWPVDAGEIKLRGEANWTGKVFFSPYNRPEISQDGFSKFNISISYEGDNGVTASMFMRNITNKQTVSTEQVSGGFLGFPVMGAYDPPRTFGASVGYRF